LQRRKRGEEKEKPLGRKRSRRAFPFFAAAEASLAHADSFSWGHSKKKKKTCKTRKRRDSLDYIKNNLNYSLLFFCFVLFYVFCLFDNAHERIDERKT